MIANPCFVDLTVNDAVELDAGNRHLLASGKYPQKLPLVGTMSCPAGYHQIAFGDLIFDGKADVGVSRTVRRDVPCDALVTMHLLCDAGVMEAIVGGKAFIYPAKVPLSKNLIEPLTNQGLILFGHRVLSCPYFLRTTGR